MGNVLVTVSDRRLAYDAYTYTNTGAGSNYSYRPTENQYSYTPSAGLYSQSSGTDNFTDYYTPDVISSTDYFVFGSPMPGRTYNSTSFRYNFNGKEEDQETVSTAGGTQDYGFRIYNPSLGKFLSVDPITAQYPNLTPYQFASNNPIMNIDIDGLEGGGAIFMPRFFFPRLTLPRVTLPTPPAIPVPSVPAPPIALPLPTPPAGAGSVEQVIPAPINIRGGIIETPDAEISYYNENYYWRFGGELDTPAEGEAEYKGAYKVPKSGKEMKGDKKKDDIPDWAKGYRPRKNESGKDWAKRLLNRKYGNGKWKEGPGSEFNQIKKFGDTHFKEIINLPINDWLKYKDKVDEYNKEYNEKMEEYNKELKEYNDKQFRYQQEMYGDQMA